MALVRSPFVALPSAAGGWLTRHPCQGAVRQLGVAARLPLKTKQMAIPVALGQPETPIEKLPRQRLPSSKPLDTHA
jgi:hypothetical protein